MWDHPSPDALSRRTFLASASVATAALLLGPRQLLAQDPSRTGAAPLAGLVPTARRRAETASVTVEKLRGRISVLSNGVGGNITVLHGKDGKLLVDAGLAGSRPQVTAALAGLGPAPVRHVVNTHWHFDHTDGNEWLHAAGATIIGHANAHKRMSEATRVELWGHTFPPSPAGALPALTLHAAEVVAVLHLNGEEVRLEAFPPAHTDGDTVVEFANAHVISLGDLWWNGLYPFVDYGVGGSIDGTIRTADVVLRRVTAETLLIPGHGPVGGRTELAAYRDMLVDVRDRVASLKGRGMSAEEVVAAKPTARYDAEWGGGLLTPDLFTTLIYAGI